MMIFGTTEKNTDERESVLYDIICGICDKNFPEVDKYGDQNFCPKCGGAMEYEEHYFPALTEEEKKLVLANRMKHR